MAQQYKSFPKELNLHLSDQIDWTFATTFLITFVVFFSSMGYFQSLPPQELSEDELKKYLQVIYRVEPEKQVVVKKTEKKQEAKAKKVEKVEEKTVEEKKQRRERQKAARESRRSKAMQAARSTGIFAAAGVMKSGGGGGRGRAGKTLGGGLGGANLSKLSGIATGTDIAKVEKMRGGGAITEGGGDIDVSKLSMKEIELMLESSTVEVEDVPEVKGAAAAAPSRSGDAIFGKVQAESGKLKNCYNRQKTKDPTLRGKVIVQYTILANGRVQRVRVRQAQWSNRSLGKRVETCLRQNIQRWTFDPVQKGDVTTEIPLLFN